LVRSEMTKVSPGSILFPSLRNALSSSSTNSYSIIMRMKLASCFKCIKILPFGIVMVFFQFEYNSLRVISEICVGEKINVDQFCFRVDIKITVNLKLQSDKQVQSKEITVKLRTVHPPLSLIVNFIEKSRTKNSVSNCVDKLRRNPIEPDTRIFCRAELQSLNL
ncbi:hypothetical protein T07_5595, partial [Trichinella nelsoni]